MRTFFIVVKQQMNKARVNMITDVFQLQQDKLSGSRQNPVKTLKNIYTVKIHYLIQF